MPNHVSHVCTVTGPADDLLRFKAELFGGDPKEMFDFNRIIPMPGGLRDSNEDSVSQTGAALIVYRASSSGPFADHAEPWSKWVRQDVAMPTESIIDVAAAYLAKHPDYEEAGRKRLQLILETGYASWYPWALANWGTKWSAYSVSIKEWTPDHLVFEFQTAWSFPAPIFAKLVDRHPTLTFDLKAFDEGWNFACVGQLGAVVQQPFTTVKATAELYEAVYGESPEEDEAA